ncbi:MAG TPA: multidrug efflux SMR transporter, partial [Micromonospora sp.]
GRTRRTGSRTTEGDMNIATAWVLLLVAALLETAFAISMKYSQGFTRLAPSLVTAVLAVASVVLLSRTLSAIPVGTAYAVWTGLGAAGVVIAGIVLFGEPATVGRLAGIGLVILGVIALRLFGG